MERRRENFIKVEKKNIFFELIRKKKEKKIELIFGYIEIFI